jgi:cysteine synthase B
MTEGKSIEYIAFMMTLTELVGNTRLVDLSRLTGKPGVKYFGKMEGDNPGGSVKDRPALSMILDAEERGLLEPGVKIIEPTSGNTGIALAMIAAAKGYEIELVMPESATRERVLSMRAFGATVTLTPKERSMEGAIDYATEKASRDDYVMLDQFSNPANPLAHYQTTGPEIWEATKGQISHFVSAMGTTGTIMGVSRFLKEKNPDIVIVGAQPSEGSKIPGIRKWPKEYLPKFYEPERVDRIVEVSQEEATAMTRRLAKECGLSCGMSAGGAANVALKVAEEIESGFIVSIVCDRGDRYLSSGLFE